MRGREIQSDIIPPVYFSCWTKVPLTWKSVRSEIYFQPQSCRSAQYKAYSSKYAPSTGKLKEI